MNPRVVAAVAPAALVASLLVGGAVYAGAGPGSGSGGGDPRTTTLSQNWTANAAGQQVLGGSREPGVPTIQRLKHDNVVFTLSIAPARPGPNLVRVDAVHLGAHGVHPRNRPVLVGTDEKTLVRARPRPGADGLWAVVDLPEGSGTVLVTHGPWHRVPFVVETGEAATAADPVWAGPDGPECLTSAIADLLSGGTGDQACPATGLDDAERTALTRVVDVLADRGVQTLAVQYDDSARSQAALALVARTAERQGVRITSPTAVPGPRDALLVLSGWADAARSLAAVSAKPLRQQPIRSDGTWLAPWLLAPGVVDSTSGAILPLDFDIRSAQALEYAQTLATYLPGQAPTGSGYRAWRQAHGQQADPFALYAASRAAYMPQQPGHAGHETQIAWFPGGTVTPVGLPLS